MPVVVATVGFGGHAMGDDYLQILKAQMAVGDPKKHPEFAGNVRSVDTRDFWREVDESPVDQGYHYNRNAETYLIRSGRKEKNEPPSPRASRVSRVKSNFLSVN